MLLLRHLSPEQFKEYRDSGEFKVASKTPWIYYVLGKHEKPYQIKMQNGLKTIFCIHTYDKTLDCDQIHAHHNSPDCYHWDYLPIGDHLLALKLLIESNEAVFLKTANVLAVEEIDTPAKAAARHAQALEGERIVRDYQERAEVARIYTEELHKHRRLFGALFIGSLILAGFEFLKIFYDIGALGYLAHHISALW